MSKFEYTIKILKWTAKNHKIVISLIEKAMINEANMKYIENMHEEARRREEN